MPTIKLPGKNKKPDSNAEKMALSPVDGSLRLLEEKNLLLETRRARVLKFRLIAKTQFINSKGDAIRDSLLHPGDKLSVEVNADDPETAVRVVLVKKGSPEERDAASVPVDTATLATPEADDLGKPRVVAVRQGSATTVEQGSDRSNSEPPAPIETASKPDSKPAAPDAEDKTIVTASDPVMAAARVAAESFMAALPNFLVRQVTTRYRGAGSPLQWTPGDIITADVAVVNGKEEYRNIAINGRRSTDPPQDSGGWSTGEYAITQEDLLDRGTQANFTRRLKDEPVGGRMAYVYDYTVDKRHGHWVIVSAESRQYTPAHEGTLWIDEETRRVLRIEQRAVDLPASSGYDRAETTIQYGWVTVNGKQYLLPALSETMACFSGSNACTRNSIEFRDYRKFSSDSTITYGKFTGSR